MPSVEAAAAFSGAPVFEPVGAVGGEMLSLTVSGDLAYIGEGSAFTILDIHDPHRPTRRARMEMPGTVLDIALVANKLFVAYSFAATDLANGVAIFDVSTPDHPIQLGAYTTASAIRSVRVVGTWAYMAANYDGLLIVDVSNPARSPRPPAATNIATNRDTTANYGADGIEHRNIVNLMPQG